MFRMGFAFWFCQFPKYLYCFNLIPTQMVGAWLLSGTPWIGPTNVKMTGYFYSGIKCCYYCKFSCLISKAFLNFNFLLHFRARAQTEQLSIEWTLTQLTARVGWAQTRLKLPSNLSTSPPKYYLLAVSSRLLCFSSFWLFYVVFVAMSSVDILFLMVTTFMKNVCSPGCRYDFFSGDLNVFWDVFSHMASWVESGIELYQFLRISLLVFTYTRQIYVKNLEAIQWSFSVWDLRDQMGSSCLKTLFTFLLHLLKGLEVNHLNVMQFAF